MQPRQTGILNAIPPPQSVNEGFPTPTPQQNKSPQQAMAEELVGGGISPALSALMKEQQALQLLRSAANEKQMQYQPPTPPTVRGQVESDITSTLAALQPGMNIKGQRMAEEAALRPSQPAAGMPGIPASNMNQMADGGIVGYASGGDVENTASSLDMDALLDAVMMTESGGDPNAVGAAGEEGAFQILPSTARQPGFRVKPIENSFDPVESRRFARQYLQAMIDRYDGDVTAALIAYNAGFGNADKFMASGRDMAVLPQRGITEPYVRKIMNAMRPERTLDFAGGRQMTTQEPEGYTQRMRREKLERNEAGIAALMPEASVVEEVIETPVVEEVIEPTGGVAALQNVGRKQQERRDAFSRAAPGAQGAIDQYADDKEQGGIASLRRVGEKQDNQRAKVDSAVDYLRMQQESQNMVNEADPAARPAQPSGKPSVAEIVKFLRMQQESQNMVNAADPAANIKGYNGEDSSLVEADTDEEIAQRNSLLAMLMGAANSQSQGTDVIETEVALPVMETGGDPVGRNNLKAALMGGVEITEANKFAAAEDAAAEDAVAQVVAMEEAPNEETPAPREQLDYRYFNPVTGKPRTQEEIDSMSEEGARTSALDPRVPTEQRELAQRIAAATEARKKGVITQAELNTLFAEQGASKDNRAEIRKNAEAKKLAEARAALGFGSTETKEVKKFDAETFPNAQAAADRYAAQGGAAGRLEEQKLNGLEAEIAALQNGGLDIDGLIALLSNSQGTTTAESLGSMGRAGAKYTQDKNKRRQDLIAGLNQQRSKREAAMLAQAQQQKRTELALEKERRSYEKEFREDQFGPGGFNAMVAEAAGVDITKLDAAIKAKYGPQVIETFLSSYGIGRGSPSSQGNPMSDTTGYTAKLIKQD